MIFNNRGIRILRNSLWDVQTRFSKPDPNLDQKVPFPKFIFMPSLYFFQIWPMLKCDEIHSKDQLQWHSLVFSLSLLFIWSKKDNYVDTFWSFNKAQRLQLRVRPKYHNTKTTATQQWFFSAYWRNTFDMLLYSDSQRLVYIDDPLWRVWFEPRLELQWKLFSTAPQINLVKLLLANAVYLAWISWRICFSSLHFKFFENIF